MNDLILSPLGYDEYNNNKQNYTEVNLDLFQQTAPPNTIVYEVSFPGYPVMYHYYIMTTTANEGSSNNPGVNPLFQIDTIDTYMLILCGIALFAVIALSLSWTFFLIPLLAFLFYHFFKSLFLQIETFVYKGLSKIFPNIPTSYYPYITILLLLLIGFIIYYVFKKISNAI